MKSLIKLFSLALALNMAFVSCDSEEDLIDDRIAQNTSEPVVYTSGTADYSKFVTIGNSLTAGFMDGALYTEGQDNSFPKIIGNQLIAAKFASAFNQPDINSVNGFNTSLNTDPAVATFGKFILDLSIPGPSPTMPGDVITPYTGNKSELNNFGVPGVRLTDLTTPATAGNGFYARFATNPGTSTIMGDVLAANPTFFSLWIGSNDVLGYATGGGVGDDPLVTYSQAQFTADFSGVIGQLVGAGSKGVAINIPPVTLIPFLRAVPYNPLPLDAQTAAGANMGYVQYNGGLAAALGAGIIDQAEHDSRVINFSEGQNSFVITDDELTDVATLSGGMIPIPQLRQTNPTDLVPLPASTVLGTRVDPMDPTTTRGVGVPLGDQFVLTLKEQTAVGLAAATYNGVIAAVTSATPGVEMYDIQPLFSDLAGLTPAQAAQLGLTAAAQAAADSEQGINFEGITLSPDFRPTGIFATDGIHPNPRGHAIVANELIDLMNEKFESNIPKVNSTTFRTVLFK